MDKLTELLYATLKGNKSKIIDSPLGYSIPVVLTEQDTNTEVRKSKSMPQDIRQIQEITRDKLHDVTNADPMSISALSLTHMHVQTSYGFTTLTELPKAFTSENLFHTKSPKEPTRRSLLSVSSSLCVSPLSRNSSFSDTRSETDNSAISSNVSSSCEDVTDVNEETDMLDKWDDLENGEIEISIKFEHKKNLFKLTLHRAKVLMDTDTGKEVFAKLCLMPDKLQRQTSKTVLNNREMVWNETFVFKKLTIGQLESNHVRIWLFERNGFLKSNTCLGEASVMLGTLLEEPILTKCVIQLNNESASRK